MTAHPITRVSSTETFAAMRFDGTRERAEAIIAWIRAAHGDAIAPGHYRPGAGAVVAAVFQPLLGGTMMCALEGQWVVQRSTHYFSAYLPEVFAKLFQVEP